MVDTGITLSKLAHVRCNIYTDLFSALKIQIYQKNVDISNIVSQNINCAHTLEAHRRVPTIYVLNKNKKKNAYHCISQFSYIKVGFNGVLISWKC